MLRTETLHGPLSALARLVLTPFTLVRSALSRATVFWVAVSIFSVVLSLLLTYPCLCSQDAGKEVAADTTKSIIAVRINRHVAGAAQDISAAETITDATPDIIAAERATDAATGSNANTRINSDPSIDGILDESFWQEAQGSGGFVQYQPDEGKAATESTSVRMAYDDGALYIGVEMYDSEPGKIINRLTRRDRAIEADLVNIIIDSHHDHQTAYAFVVYASGTQRDVYYYNDTWSDDSWDGVWESATKTTDRGWIAEVKIPFSCLRFSNGNDSVWGIYFSRNICRKGELDRWVRIPESASGFVSMFGHLKGLNGLLSPKRLEILPYGVSYAETEDNSVGNPDGRSYTHNAGFDVKYGLTSNMTLNATINPDFGQVEADQTILNLSTFEIQYPEKRPFFLEGNKIFETYFNLFYSRRIGKSPSVWPDDTDYYVNRPTATTILGAAKISGKTAGGTSIGILESVTQREKATYMSVEGTRKTAVIEPEANYLVARVTQDIMENSSIGVMATAVNQKSSDPNFTGGADCNLRFRDGDYLFIGQVVGSRVGPNKNGWGGVAYVEKAGGEHIRGSVRGEYRDRALDLNRLGFIERSDLKEAFTWLQYRTTGKRWVIKRTWHNLNTGISDNLSGVRLLRGGNVNSQIEFTNLWSMGGGSWQDYQNTYADFETRGGPPAPLPIGRNWWLWVSTDGRKKWQLYGEMGGGDTWDGHYNSCSLSLELRPASNIELSVGPNYRKHWGVSRWLTYLTDAEGNRTDDIFGEQFLHRLDMTLRGTVTFSKNMSFQAYAQPFIAAMDYRHFKKLVPPDDFEYVDSSVYDEAEQKPDFNWTSFNSNLVLRWEYRPGSALYLVWTQARGSTRSLGDFKPDRDLDSLFDTTPNNTFLIKVSYWWSV